MKRVRSTITVPCRAPALHEVGDLVRKSLHAVGLPAERKELIRECVEETLGSMIRFSDHKGYAHDISVTTDVDGERFRVVFAEGKNDFEVGAGSDLAGDATYRMGTALARRVMTEISYTYKKGARNELELVHRL
ncbi:MAG: hypothetical protein HYY17_04040 [Planctomycetes bacterium]|nr:hypothetical protein [Planctomycetota bacterium]